MELLFNEQFGDGTDKRDFYWYQTGAESLDALAEQIDEIASIAKKNVSFETCYYFYTKIVNGDAIEDQVRTAIYVRRKVDGGVDMNFNIADSQMAMSMDAIVAMKMKLHQKLM